MNFSQQVQTAPDPLLQDALLQVEPFISTEQRIKELTQVNQALLAELAEFRQREAALQVELARQIDAHRQALQFVSHISHESRTSLTAIQSSTELLENYAHKFTAEKKTEIYGRVYEGVQVMTNLLNDAVFIGQLQSGKVAYQPEKCDPAEFVTDLMATYAAQQTPTTPRPEINVKIEFEAAQIVLDKRLTGQMLLHLLNNAVHYSSENSKIELRLDSRSETLIFTVKDQGMGIPPQDYERLFEAFSRGSNARHIQGTGLGQTIVKHCVELHQGTLDFESEEGQGSIFTIKLPQMTC